MKTATVLAMGELSDIVVSALDDPDLYAGASAGIKVVSAVMQASSSLSVLDLADALGVNVYDPGTFEIDVRKVRMPCLREVISNHPLAVDGYVEDFEVLAQNGFTFFFHLS